MEIASPNLSTGENNPGVVPLTQSNPEALFPCRKGCGRAFSTFQGRNVHELRKHGKGWNTVNNFHSRAGKTKEKAKRFPSMNAKYRKGKYNAQVAAYHAKGLNAHGNPFKSEAARLRALSGKGKFTPAGRKRISEAMKARWRKVHAEHTAQLLNGAAASAEQPQQPDNIGEAAKAIILAAQVLRSVTIGLKL